MFKKTIGFKKELYLFFVEKIICKINF